MFHRFDPHVHTWFSADAAGSPEAVVAAARARGLSGIALTDHNTCDAVRYCYDQGLARPDGAAVDGFLVVPGVEVSTAEGHLLCLGVVLDDRKGAPALEVVREVEALGGLAIPAHPYDRWRAGIREEVLDSLPVRLLEVFNAAVTARSYNRQARDYATKRGWVMTAGSDAHHASAVGTAATGLEMPELTVAAFLQALQAGTTLEENYLSRSEGVKKHLGNWLRILNPRPKPRLAN